MNFLKKGDKMNNYRRREALRLRIEAAELAAGRVHPRHVANGDEQHLIFNS